MGQGELILLADDEPHIRTTIAEVLETMGYKILLAKDGLEALEVFKAHQDEIALAMLDVVMPHCGGIELAERIREMNPDMPIIFVTGYDKTQLLNGEKYFPNSDTPSKPMQFGHLSHIIREKLGSL